ncbi:5-methyltetrahydropteroyltriglutamate--homocysteine S-methyltransferase [Acinetobacter qingfengensis]|uniref:5-methyltetrahydropteroyltriglutamate--homocysteine methyltransferase n=1 Tax=Acinetobacter qingfengensis TaxID=1262585 RepID=A0A1E7R2T3_9GAMM|nr:5-methyltetrahydropteroyltriglutamate--homocysteine S-methyltransferase [Acinetobacter qingfengensis]KAA8733839.1 5-methyltetrahydropteroyltriglutamate--homocysteine S-methyltransferase [Acinetobacter qingfengensis]OEY93649.1 5-methyltetrahydropteroyltriglutamate--homocysteine methyltransferase [Acinetobacter qingfengensis]
MSNTNIAAKAQYVGFKADHVGSFLRPERLKQARQKFAQGKISHEDLTQIENEEILKLIEQQKQHGVKAITDGELRRAWWHFDFMENLLGAEGFDEQEGYKFHGVETKPHQVRITGKLAYNPHHPHFEHFKFLKDALGDDATHTAKMTIPSPNMFMQRKIRINDVYGNDLQQYAEDLGQAYQQSIRHFYDLGCRYLQLDDVYWAFLVSKQRHDEAEKFGDSTEEIAKACVKTLNIALEYKPEDLIIGMHICRGNFASAWIYEGGYDSVEDYIFQQIENVDRYFLEYDDQRSGGFSPLAKLKGKNAEVVLGLITSKVEQLEDKQAIIARIHEAAEFLPLTQLALSPQCGFSSTEEGNRVDYDAQWKKLELINEIVAEVWEQ